MGDGDRVGTGAKTASVLKPYSLFLDAKTQHDFFFFLGLHVLREHRWNIEKVSLYVLLTAIL